MSRKHAPRYERGTRGTPKIQRPTKTIEPPIGENEQNIRRKVGQYHVMTPTYTVFRAVFGSLSAATQEKLRTKKHRPLLRGLYLAVAEIHRENRHLFMRVSSGNFLQGIGS